MFYQNNNFINKLVDICKKSNEIALKIYDNYVSNGINITYKNDNSPLTEADLRVNEYICEELNKMNNIFNKNILIISEENKNRPYNERSKFDWVWLIDPIDGTKEFLKKNGQFTVNIGLCFKGDPVFGVVGIPVEHCIYYGCKNIGSYKLNTKNNNSVKIKCSKFSMNNSDLRIVCSSSHMNKDTEKYISNFKNPKLKSAGSSIKLLKVAEGEADIYPRIAPTSEWDTCASHAVVLYSGGNVVQYNSTKNVKYNKENLLNPYFICMGIDKNSTI